MDTTRAPEIGSDLWNARVYAGLSIASELAAGLNRPTLAAVSFFSAWKIYLRLGRLNRDLDEIFRGYDQPVPFPPISPGEWNSRGRDILLKLHADCTRLVSPAGDIPFKGPIGNRLAQLQSRLEHILDIADWFDAMSMSEETNAKFGAALSDLEKGDVIPWAAMK